MIDVIVTAENNKDQSVRQAIIDSNLERLKMVNLDGEGPDIQDLNSGIIKHTTFFEQFPLLYKRSVLNTTRSPLATFVQLFQALFFSLLLGSIYFGVCFASFKSFNDVMMAIIFRCRTTRPASKIAWVCCFS